MLGILTEEQFEQRKREILGATEEMPHDDGMEVEK